MKKFIALSALFTLITLNARHDCLDTSKHLQQKYDTKTEHLVGCNCPCDEFVQFQKHNKCMMCEHIHYPKRVEMINKQTAGNAEGARLLQLFGNPDKSIRRFVHLKIKR